MLVYVGKVKLDVFAQSDATGYNSSRCYFVEEVDLNRAYRRDPLFALSCIASPIFRSRISLISVSKQDIPYSVGEMS